MKYEKDSGKGFDQGDGGAIGRLSFLQLSPWEVPLDRIRELGLATLADEGYGLDPDFEYDIERARRLLGEGELSIALSQGVAVGAILVKELTKEDTVYGGRTFWKELALQDPKIVTSAESLSEDPVAAHITAMMTLRDYRQQGIQRQLAEQTINKLKPSIIFGETRNPAAVASGANVLKGFGYRTFLGEMEVTPGEEEVGFPHKAIHSAFFKIAGRSTPPGFVRTLDVGNLPALEGFAPPIQRAFAPLIEEQKRDNSVVLGLPLISVRRELLATSK
jgi:GNAT superfamily N-acetyltransferase